MRKILIIGVLILTSTAAFSQGAYKPINLGTFDRKVYHFGFLLGFNSADVYIDRKSDFASQDSLLSLNSKNQSGFNLGIVAAYHFNKNISVRFLPTLSFEDRVLNYVFYAGPDSTTRYEKRIESTYIDFPINFKFRTDRLRNSAFYALAGGRYRINMQSEKDVKNEVADKILVKTDNNDFAVEFGGGVDLYLQYFKFGIELKMVVGVKNLLIPEATQFSNPLESLRSRTLLISFTFEG
ncbi:PorT family protein [Cryomorpha ignava]|uniref:PorT family protein n=1 Tax=Cryomorpha ignava TaxID=101383 RepID=A0A7K3WQQ2_9FLAO|nr:outer membrane beta-barrel protein [Cryomorpha ignava]NEN23351.1 PorT family protein [Cryomorpha ignava]